MVLRTLTTLVILVFLFSCNSSNKPEDINKESELPGKKLYGKICSTCHGYDGQMGLGGAANLAISQIDKDSAISIITNGRGAMIPYGGMFSEEEVEQIATYLQTLKK